MDMNNPASRTLLLTILTLGAGLVAPVAGRAAKMANYFVYVGTYTGPKSQGIYVYKFETATGALTPMGVAAETTNPSFLVIHPNQRFVYAVNELQEFEGKKGGSVSAFSMNVKTGRLTFLNALPSDGTDPCYVALDHTGKYAMIANYTSGSVAVFPILPDGKLGKATAFIEHKGHGVNPERQEGPHAHSINPSPDNRFAIAADLGLDKLLVYRFDAGKGTLSPDDPPFATVPAGSGPRHFAFHPSGQFAYTIGEMGSNVTAFSYDARGGVLHPLQTISTLPKDYKGRNDCAEVQVHPSGKFLYGSNRGHESIAVFTIDQEKGTLTPLEYVPTQGQEPRNFGIDPTGTFLIAANQNSNSLVVFRIDANTGHLTPTGQKLEVQAPVCVKFTPMP